MKRNNDDNFLFDFLSIYPNVPQHALWRAVEAKLLSQQTLDRPILDIGCGDGTFSSVVFKNNRGGIYGCDSSADTAARAAQTGLYEEVQSADARRLPYNDSFFSSAFSNCVLEHIPEDEKVISEIARVLKPGGVFVFTVPSVHFKSNLNKRSGEYLEKLDRRLEHYHYRTSEEWTAILGKHGLEIKKNTTFFPPDVLIKWDSMMNFYAKEIMGRELSRLLISKKLGLKKFTYIFLPHVFKLLLSKWYEEGLKEDESGSVRFISAIKTGL